MSFLPDEYKAPISNYLKFIEGENTFRILGNAIVGYEYWNTKNKPVRSKEPFEDVPADIQMDKEGKFMPSFGRAREVRKNGKSKKK